tara:strand:+ start:61 stop:513 length:453 start_codon:yes stop_codon:yes gene_type:complete
MGTINALGSERAAVAAVIDPDANTAAAYTSAYVSMSTFNQVLAIVQTGTLGSSATVDFKLVQATDSSGTSVKDISGKSVTQLVKASNDDDQAVINCRSEELDVDNGFDYVAMVMTVGTAASDTSAIMLGMTPRYAPASDNDLASVQEIVS